MYTQASGRTEYPNKKICLLCKNKLEFIKFRERRSNKDGYETRCNSCLNELSQLKKDILTMNEEEKTEMFYILYYKSKLSVLQCSYIFKCKAKDLYPFLIKYGKLRCTKCDTIKYLSDFYKDINQDSGYSNHCAKCKIDSIDQDNRKKYRDENKERFKPFVSQWSKDNREYLAAKQRERRKRIDIKLKDRVSGIIWRALKKNKQGTTWSDFVDFSFEEFKEHLENQFRDGMSWDNYGEWHIDHIIPYSSFNITSSNCEDFKKCNALENFQPLWATENLSKGSKLDFKL